MPCVTKGTLFFLLLPGGWCLPDPVVTMCLLRSPGHEKRWREGLCSFLHHQEGGRAKLGRTQLQRRAAHSRAPEPLLEVLQGSAKISQQQIASSAPRAREQQSRNGTSQQGLQAASLGFSGQLKDQPAPVGCSCWAGAPVAVRTPRPCCAWSLLLQTKLYSILASFSARWCFRKELRASCQI